MPRPDYAAIGRAVAGLFRRDEEAAPAAPVIRWDADAEAFVLDGGEYATRDDALEAVLAGDWATAALDRKKPDKVVRDGWTWRWFDSTSVEDLPAVDGTQLTERDLDDMIRNLAARKKPIEIRGAYVTSEGHEAGKGAAGWGFVAVKVIEADGQPHMWLRGCVNADVEDALSSGRVLYGSIGFIPESVDPYSQEPIGTELHHYALLNDSYRDDLEPHAPVPRARVKSAEEIAAFLTTTDLAHPGDPVMTRSRPRALSTRRGPMPAKNIRNDHTQTIRVLRMKRADRGAMLAAVVAALAAESLSDTGMLDAIDLRECGPAKDKLDEILRLLKIEKPADADSTWDPYWQVSQTVSALQAAAKVEDILSAEGAAPPADDASRSIPGSKTKVRAEDEGEAGAGEGDAAATNDLIALLRRVLGLTADASLADVLDKAKAAEDALKGAVGGGETKEEEPGGGDEGGMRAKSPEAIALRTEVATLTKAVKAQGDELATLRAEKRRGVISARVAKRFADCKLELSDADRDDLVDLMAGAKDDATADRIMARALPAAFRTAGRDNESMPEGGANRGGPSTGGSTIDGQTAAILRELPDALRTALTGRDPYTAAEKQAWRDATLAAHVRNPQLFSDAASSAVGD